LTSPEGGANRRRPSVFLDHVLIPVTDLEPAAERFQDVYGLVALPGGRHPGVGTANMIIPLGHTYIELIAVVDPTEAAAFPRSARVAEAAREGRPFAAWAARTDDLSAVREAYLGRGEELPRIQPGARTRPDGVTLEWRSQELSSGLEPSVLPFLIEWHVPAGMHPAEAAADHPSGAGDIVFARFEDPDPAAGKNALEDLMAGNLAFSVDRGERCALVEVRLEVPGGRLSIP
jgi:hypothetical protein